MGGGDVAPPFVCVCGSIAAVEERLGVSLPDDYKEFLRVSNGMGLIPALNVPTLRPVEELKWEDPKDLGLTELWVDLGVELGPNEHTKMPKPERLFVISGDYSEEMTWVYEPVQVESALGAIRAVKQEALDQGRLEGLSGFLDPRIRNGASHSGCTWKLPRWGFRQRNYVPMVHFLRCSRNFNPAWNQVYVEFDQSFMEVNSLHS
ncbi:hypothetical protein OBBRIDRAFT_544180 [Obba rivulosa]|uniref:Knr4/Smi1-like domain-containing protein n=1 Tax=Obba rivulosa TaxID=1052685 RepID=A0A8E2AZT7_9APHY|nr:hypothetical protein OBBRIDRAFT_544180 [Obba rivulosa]